MIGYVTVGTNKFDEAAKFYDELLATIGAGRMMEAETFIAWSAEGAPGKRGGNFYAGYFRDLDGNKLNAFCLVSE